MKLIISKVRTKYFSNPVLRADPHTTTFEHQDHLHYLLYRGSDIVGYLHLQFLRKLRSVLCVIFIDEEYRGRGLGKKFLTDMERWLSE